jgi:hypothetical protein
MMKKTSARRVAKPPRPLYPEEAIEQIGQRKALVDAKNLKVDLNVLVAANGRPEVTLNKVGMKGGEVQPDGVGKKQAEPYELRLSIANAALGTHVLPPKVKVREFDHHEDILKAQRRFPEFDGYLPDHLPMRVTPKRLPEKLRVPRRIQLEGALVDKSERPHMATTVFGTDDRYTFNDTAFPWCTVGKVETPGGWGSGAMVGPRHLLTCSHAIQWNSDGSAGWVKFTPSYYDGSAPFGFAWGTSIYWEGQKVYGPSISRSEGQHDYVCVVLNNRIGELTGWMGSTQLV